MTKKFLIQVMPNIETLQHKKGFKKISAWLLKHPYLLHVQRRKVALGFALGIGFGVIPLPVQVIASLFFCYIFRANAAAALLSALVYNPLTYPFVLAFTFQVGALVCATNFMTISFPAFSLLISHPLMWFSSMANALHQVGNALLVGIPITGLFLGFIAYWLVKIVWFWAVIIQRKRRTKLYPTVMANHKNSISEYTEDNNINNEAAT